jgi:hypothetical protein
MSPFIVFDEELEIARSVASKAAFSWRSVEREDLESVLILWLYEHPKQVERFRELEHGQSSLRLSLRRLALRHCLKESSASQGQEIGGDFEA